MKKNKILKAMAVGMALMMTVAVTVNPGKNAPGEPGVKKYVSISAMNAIKDPITGPIKTLANSIGINLNVIRLPLGGRYMF